MDKLRFLSTVSADEFKAQKGIDRIDILRNETSGKCFFSFKDGTGAVYAKYPTVPLTEPMVSEVQEEGSEKPFYLLHNKGESSATKMESL